MMQIIQHMFKNFKNWTKNEIESNKTAPATQEQVNAGQINDLFVSPLTLRNNPDYVFEPTSSTATAISVSIPGVTSMSQLYRRTIKIRRGWDASSNPSSEPILNININNLGNLRVWFLYPGMMSSNLVPYSLHSNSVLEIFFPENLTIWGNTNLCILTNYNKLGIAEDSSFLQQGALYQVVTPSNFNAAPSRNGPINTAICAIYYARKSGWVNLMLEDIIFPSSLTFSLPAGTIPVGFRPAAAVITQTPIIASNLTTVYGGVIIANPNGGITFQNYAATASNIYQAVTLSYPM